MRRLFVCTLMMTLLGACNMCSKKEAPATDDTPIPAPVATTSPAASNACEELKCAPDQVQPSKGPAVTAAPSPAPAPPTSAPTSLQGPVGGATVPTASVTPQVPTVAPPAAPSTPSSVSSDSDQQLRLSRDPFRRYIGGGGMPSRYPELTNLPLTSFRYVGIVKNEGENLALLEDRAGNGHTVRVGTRIGKEGGQISQISEQEIVVKALRKDSSGRSTTKYFRLPFYVKM